MNLLKNYFKDWSKFEIAWLLIFTAVIVYVGVAFDDTWIGFVASLTGIWCVLLVAKGKIENYYFGIVNILAYAYISFGVGLYGEVMLNMLFYMPIQFIGLYLWYKNKSEDTNSVKVKKMNAYHWGALALGVLAIGIAYSYFLESIDGQQATIDSFAVVLSVFAQILMVLRFAEQWILWIIVNVLSIILWTNVFMDGGESITVLVMWIAYLINSVYGYYSWLKLGKGGLQNA